MLGSGPLSSFHSLCFIIKMVVRFQIREEEKIIRVFGSVVSHLWLIMGSLWHLERTANRRSQTPRIVRFIFVIFPLNEINEIVFQFILFTVLFFCFYWIKCGNPNKWRRGGGKSSEFCPIIVVGLIIRHGERII